MTPAELAVGRRFAEALAALDANAALALVHAQIGLRLPCVVLHGRAGLRQLLARAALDDAQDIAVEEAVAIGERVLTLGRIDGRPVGAILELRDGLVAGWQPFPDAELAFAAAGAVR
jgi:hypothetical protein